MEDIDRANQLREQEETRQPTLWEEIKNESDEAWEFSNDTEKVISLGDLKEILERHNVI